MPDPVEQQLLRLLAVQRGHFEFESGDHGDTWLDLDALFFRPQALRPIADELAGRLATYGVEAVCGPMVGGALLAQMIAETLGTEFYFTRRDAAGDPAGVCYPLPDSLRPRIRGKSVAVVDDAINAGSAMGGTLAELRAAGARPVVISSLVLVGSASETFVAAQKMPHGQIARVAGQLWPAATCPLCAAGVPLTS